MHHRLHGKERAAVVPLRDPAPIIVAQLLGQQELHPLLDLLEVALADPVENAEARRGRVEHLAAAALHHRRIPKAPLRLGAVQDEGLDFLHSRDLD
jgi:hypothetical protein